MFAILADAIQTVQQLEHEIERQGIAAIGPIQSDHRDILFRFKTNVLVARRTSDLMHRHLPVDSGEKAVPHHSCSIIHILASRYDEKSGSWEQHGECQIEKDVDRRSAF